MLEHRAHLPLAAAGSFFSHLQPIQASIMGPESFPVGISEPRDSDAYINQPGAPIRGPRLYSQLGSACSTETLPRTVTQSVNTPQARQCLSTAQRLSIPRPHGSDENVISQRFRIGILIWVRSHSSQRETLFSGHINPPPPLPLRMRCIQASSHASQVSSYWAQ